MRVAHVVGVFLPKSETFIYTQIDALSDLDQLVLARRVENRELFPFAPVWRMGAASRALGGVARRGPVALRGLDPFPRRLTRALRSFAPDLIHAHFAWGGMHALQAARRLDVPLVVTVYGRDVYSPLFRPRSSGGPYDDLFETAAAYTSVGPRLRDELVKLGAPRERTHVVPLGIPLELFPFRPTPLHPARLVLLHVARLVGKKGTDTALRAFATIRREVAGAQLWLVGDGPQRERLHTLAVQLDVVDAVTFYGALPNARVRELMSRSHIGLQPSRVADDGDQEGTPTVIIEMEARGLDVVATRHADIPFIVPDPERLIAENDDAALAAEVLRRVDEPDAVRHERLSAARALVERNHDAAAVATRFREIYAGVGVA